MAGRGARPSAFDPERRRLARCCAAQAIYQWQLANQPCETIIDQFVSHHVYEPIDWDYFRRLLSGVIDKVAQIDSEIAAAANRDTAILTPVELAVLRLGAYELFFEPQLPHKVAINEALELAKMYGTADGFKFVNGVLDKLMHAAVKH